MNVLVVDPGKKTGIARWRDETWRAFALDWDDAIPHVHTLLASGHYDLCVFEDFVITGRTLKTGGDWKRGVELEFIGVGRYLSKLYGVEFETQTPSEAMSWGTDAKLRALNWYMTGPDHCNAASRHLMLALMRHKVLDLAALAKKLEVS